MLDSLSKRQKNKKQHKIDEALNKGYLLIEKKEYKQATIELTLAQEKGSDAICKQIEEKFNAYSQTNNYEAIRALGLVVLKKRQNDFELLNTLGNCSRKLNETKQATHFFRRALKLNNSFLKAFYNLAASMGNVDKYDEEVSQALTQFEKAHSFFLPEYLNDRIIKENLSFEDTCAELKIAIKENWRNRSITEGKLILQNDIFNLGLYALSQKRRDMALENFKKLKKQNSQVPYLDMLIALANALDRSKIKSSIKDFIALLKETPKDRYLNGNLGLLYRKDGNKLLSCKFLLICSVLLEKSEGFFNIAALTRFADNVYESGKFKKALMLYKKISLEIDDIKIWERIGELHFELNESTESLKAYREVQRLEPESIIAKQKLAAIYSLYLDMASKLKQEKKYQQAIVIMERALTIQRPPDLLEDTANTYRLLRDHKRAEELMDEYQETVSKIEENILEAERKQYIIKGQEYMKKKEFALAIENMEKASRIKLDKDIFMLLAHIYKKLKRTRALQDLLSRWTQTQISGPKKQN